MKRFVVHIDRLLLNGFHHADRHAIAQGLEHELGRMVADREMVYALRARGATSRMDVSGVRMKTGARPHDIGRTVARGIGKEMAK
jgi:hypothetical protein